jgi:hypothetical protein
MLSTGDWPASVVKFEAAGSCTLTIPIKSRVCCLLTLRLLVELVLLVLAVRLALTLASFSNWCLCVGLREHEYVRQVTLPVEADIYRKGFIRPSWLLATHAKWRNAEGMLPSRNVRDDLVSTESRQPRPVHVP